MKPTQLKQLNAVENEEKNLSKRPRNANSTTSLTKNRTPRRRMWKALDTVLATAITHIVGVLM
jgi:23S rRNA maturation mini-RNase III